MSGRGEEGGTAHSWDVMYEIIQQNKTKQTKAKKWYLVSIPSHI